MRPLRILELMALVEDCHDYIHKAYVWVVRELRPDELTKIKSLCRNVVVVKHGGWHYANGKPLYQIGNYPFTHRLELICPKPEALPYLDQLMDTSATYAEPARDLIMPNDGLALEIHRAYDLHYVQPYQGKHQRRSWANGGTSTGSRRGQFGTWYSDEPSRETGQLSCFHFEKRMKTPALRAIGIKTAGDLAKLNLAKLFQSKTQYYAIDLERLGRNHRNQLNGTRDRHSNEKGYYKGKSRDWHTGNILWRANACDNSGVLSVQTFISNYGRGPYLTAFSVTPRANGAADAMGVEHNNFELGTLT